MADRFGKRIVNEREVALLASAGLRTAVRLLAQSRNEEIEMTIEYCIQILGMDSHHFSLAMARTGLPGSKLGPFLACMKANGVPFGKHQLKPTKAIMEMHKFDASRSTENGRGRVK